MKQNSVSRRFEQRHKTVMEGLRRQGRLEGFKLPGSSTYEAKFYKGRTLAFHITGLSWEAFRKLNGFYWQCYRSIDD
jgi:hypothetical protein